MQLFRIYWSELGTYSDKTFKTKEAAEDYRAMIGMIFEVVTA